MKQPDLGKKITELRLAKGLTQEELVEKCNISVRTIQRIEAGEVSPRSYTIKTILAALDYDLSQFSDEEKNIFDKMGDAVKRFLLIDIDVEKPSDYIITQLNIAWILGIIYFITGFFEAAADHYLYEDGVLIYSTWVYVVIKVVVLITFAFFQRGFILIGGLFRNYLLKIMSFILMFAYAILCIYDIVAVFSESADAEFVLGASALTFGVIGILYGIALLRLKKPFGRISTLAGVLEIVAGSFLLTILLALVGLLLYIPSILVQIILIFKAIELVKSKQTEVILG